MLTYTHKLIYQAVIIDTTILGFLRRTPTTPGQVIHSKLFKHHLQTTPHDFRYAGSSLSLYPRSAIAVRRNNIQ
jgi:hypothetical protein